MKAIILAAWEWTRLRPITYKIPKPLIKVWKKNILEHTMNSIYKYVDEIIIVVKYKKEKIINYFWDNYKSVKLTYHIQWEEKWTWAAIKWIKCIEKSDYLIIAWDQIFDKNSIKKILNLKWYWCLVKEVKKPEIYWIFKTDKKLYALELIEKPKEYMWSLANISFYKVNSEIFNLIKSCKISERWELEITDAISLFIKSFKFKLIKWDTIDIWNLDNLIELNKNSINIKFKTPKLWDFYPLKKVWDYIFWVWLIASELDSIIKYSQDKSDKALLENTSDSKRFKDLKSLEKWYKDNWRYVFSIIDNKWNISWFWQARPCKKPIIKEFIDKKNYKLLENNLENIHTSGIRIYPEHRWKKLAWPLIDLSHKYYKKIYPNFVMSIDIENDNLASQKSFERFWYKLIWYWENQKTVEASKKSRSVYIFK